MSDVQTVIIGLIGVLVVLGGSLILTYQAEKRAARKRREEFDEDHALDEVMNSMLEGFTEEEIMELMEEDNKDKDAQ